MVQTTENTAAVAWTEANREYLRAELYRIRLLFRRKVRWLRHNWQQDPLGNNRGVVISDANAERLLSGALDEEEARFCREDAESLAITRFIEEAEADLSLQRQGLRESNGIPALEGLARSFGLTPLERDALLLCFAVEDDPGFATLCAYLQDDVNARYVTPHLAVSVLCKTVDEREAAGSVFLPAAPLRGFRLLTLMDSGSASGLSYRPLRIDERVADYVRGINWLDEQVAFLLRPVQSAPIAGAHLELVEQMVRWAESVGGRAWPPFHLTGPEGAGKEALAKEFCARAGLQLCRLEPRRLPLQDTDRHNLIHLIERETVLSRIALYIDLSEVDAA